MGGRVLASEKSSLSFTPDRTIQKIAEGYSLDAIKFAKKKYGITLDWSDASIANVEVALALMHGAYMKTQPQPTEEHLLFFARGFGSYLGEVYRRNHGAAWGMVHLNGQQSPGIRNKSGKNFRPWERALDRIMKGAANNMADYYKLLLEKSP
jgi:hypothetical protein